MTAQDSAMFDLLALIADFPVTATWDGNDYEGTAGGVGKTRPNVSGGFLPEYDLSWITTRKKRVDDNRTLDLTDRFPADVLPDAGDKLTIDDVEYRIARREIDEYNAGIRYDLVSEDKH